MVRDVKLSRARRHQHRTRLHHETLPADHERIPPHPLFPLSLHWRCLALGSFSLCPSLCQSLVECAPVRVSYREDVRAETSHVAQSRISDRLVVSR